MRSARWLFVAAFATAAVTVGFLGAAIVQTDDARIRSLVLVGILVFIVFAVAAGMWGIALRREVDPLAERAETASKLAHELKNPLMAIKGLASTGARLFDQMTDEERREFFGLIDEETGRLKRIVEQSVTALRVDAQRISYDLRETDLSALVEEVAWASPHAQHPMTVDAEPGVGVRADRKHLGEAIENLIDNAAKYSPPDAPIEVTVGHGDEDDAVIEVADRGPGIAAEHRDVVFERFGRWRPAGYEETPGAGLGLFIARAHVIAHDGRIDVVEREDGGTILRVTLPREG